MNHDSARTAPDGSPAPEPATAESPREPAAAPAPAPPVDTNSRIERRLWLLRRGADRAEGRSGIKFGRREFRVYVNGGLLWSRNYALDETAQFDADAASRFDEFVGLGWQASGDPSNAT